MDVLIGKVARELAALEEEMDRALDRAFGSGLQFSRRVDSFRPAIDVYETGASTVVRVDLAGVDSRQIRLIVDGEYLQISGYRAPDYAEPPVQHLQMEIAQGHFERVLRLARPFDPAQVRASLDNGILTVELARARRRARRIPVDS